MGAFLCERLVAIADHDERTRQAIAALVWIHFGVDSISAPSVSLLMPMLAGHRPALIVVAGDANEHCPRHLFNWLPFVPFVALGASVRNVREDRIMAVLPRPIDAERLLSIVGTAVTAARHSNDFAPEEVRPIRNFIN
jgi:hypothetical protein